MPTILKDSHTIDNIPSDGLSSEEARRRLEENGRNILAEKKSAGPIRIFFCQFKDFMVMILLAATALSAFLGEIYDAITIILIVLLNAILGFIQEYRTERTLEALSEMAAPTANVRRDGRTVKIPAAEVVLGDIVELSAGDRVPADCAVISARQLFADESILTGESSPTEKTAGTAGEGLRDPHTVYAGTIITKGGGRGRVTAVGKATQMGRISDMLTEIDRGETPLQKKLGELGRVLAIICLAVCAVVFAAGVLRGEPVFDMLMTGITIAIAAIPEGLPAAVTISLALAVRRMLKRNALVNRLHSVETLGCASVICTDKTGTITENRMTVTKIFSGGRLYSVSGTGHRIAGEITLDGGRINPLSCKPLLKTLTAAVVCSDSSIYSDKYITARDRGALTAGGEWQTVGDPTETALLIAAAKGGVTAENSPFTKYDEIPFDSASRTMTVYAKSRSEGKRIFVKGAADAILPRCRYFLDDSGAHPLTEADRRRILAAADSLAAEALRVIAMAEKDGDGLPEAGLTFLGLAGMLDPPRKEAKTAVRLCRLARIRTVMITGDHKNTAAAVAKSVGIMRGGERAVTGAELHLMSDEELSREIGGISVFARVDPSDKLRIVRTLRRQGHIVAMTGDGVNDAPAVKEADIGVSMGLTGTDVTKQAADVVLLDDNFATLVAAVEEGRCIYANIRKFVRYLLSCNIGEVITMFFGIIMGMPMVLLPTQLLLVNLATDGLPAIALGAEPAERSIMEERPRNGKEGFFAGGLMSKIIFRGVMIGLCTLGCFSYTIGHSGSVEAARTAALFTLVASQLLHVFECKDERKNIFTVPYLNNIKLILAVLISAAAIFAAIYLPPLAMVFDTVPLGGGELLAAAGFAAVIPLVFAVSGIFKGRS